MGQQVIGIFRMAKHLLIDQVSFEDHMTTELERSFDLRNERALQIIDVENQIVFSFRKSALLEIQLLKVDLEMLLLSMKACRIQRDFRDIHGSHFKASLRQVNCVSSFSCCDIQASSGRELPAVGLQY